MPRISRSSLVISIAVLIAIFATACEAAVEKPTAEPDPPTPVPTVAAEAVDNAASTSGISIREALGDPEIVECLAEQLGMSAEDAAAGIGPELFGRLGPAELGMLETCGVDAGQRAGGGFQFGGGLTGGAFADPEIRECLTGILGEDALDNLGQGSGLGLDPESLAAFEECGLNFGDGAERRFGGGGGGFVGSGIADPEIRECLTGILGEDALDNLGQGSGLGLDPESLAAFEECGLNFGDGGGGFRFGGRGGTFGGDDGIFGGGGLRGGFGTDGSFQECLTDALGEDALAQLRNPAGAPSEELQEALAQCAGGIAIPVEPDGGIGDGAGPIPIEPAVEPTATSIPVSELTIEQLTCLSGELEPSDLASAVIATSSGDLSEIPDEVLSALQICGVGA